MKWRLISRTVALILILLAGGVSAEPTASGTIEGAVYDLNTGEPIAGAWVRLVGTSRETTTDSLGHFTFQRVPAGSRTLKVNHPDYIVPDGPVGVTVTVSAGQTVRASVPLTKLIPDAAAGRADNYKSVPDRLKAELGVFDIMDSESATCEPRDVKSLKLRPSGKVGVLSAVPMAGISGSGDESASCWEDSYRHRAPADMFFRDYGTHGFVDTKHDRSSTFGADVDDASYNLIRRYLSEGNLPPKEAIRVEEFINHFDYGYNPPEYERFRVFTETVASPFDSRTTLMKIGVKGKETEREDRTPVNLTFVIDVSGSMGYGNRIGLLKRSLRLLISQLGQRDCVGIVAYGSRAFVALEPVPANRMTRIEQAINSLRPGGSTNAEAGLKLGYRMADRQFVNGHTNRIVLCSDGVANVGRTSADAIMDQVGRCARKGITLSTFGFGMGNYNDVLLERLAQMGNGRYAYVNDDAEARRQFVRDFVSNMLVLARDVKIQVEFNPEVVRSYRLIGYENRDVPDRRFRDDRQDGGEIGVGHEVTALYELILNGPRRSERAATVFVRWKNTGETQVTELSRDVSLREKCPRFDNARAELRLAIVAGRFAELLKGTEYCGDGSYGHLLRLAQPLAGELPGEQTRELLDLIRRARDLSGYYSDWQLEEPGDANYRSRR